MATLELDIRANDEMEKSALAAADALDKVASKENEVDAAAKKIAHSYSKIADKAGKVAKSTGAERVEIQHQKAAASWMKEAKGKEAASKKKEAAARKKQLQDEKERKKVTIDIGKAAAIITGAVVGAAVAAVAFGTALAAAAKSAFDTRREASALVSAFSEGAGAENLKVLDALARKLGESIDTVRRKFVEYRTAGLTSKQSAGLIKMRADLMAVGLSAAAADVEIGRVTERADGFGNQAALTQLKELSKAYGGIGSGAKAAAKAGHTLESAQNRLADTATKALSDLWAKIGPSIGEAANRLATFAERLLGSKEGREAIDSLAKSFKEMAAAVNAKNLNGILEAAKSAAKLASALGKIATFKFSGVEQLGQMIENGLRPLEKLIDSTIDELGVLSTRMYAAGVSLVDNLVSGLTSRVGSAIDGVGEMMNKMGGAVRKFFGVDPAKNIQQQSAPIDSLAAPALKSIGYDGGAPPMLGGGGAGSITIEQLIVQGGGTAQENATAIRRELQKLLNAGALSRGSGGYA